MDEQEVLEELERGVSDEPVAAPLDSAEVQEGNGDDSAGGLDEGQTASAETGDTVAAPDDADADKDVEHVDTLSLESDPLASQLMRRFDTLESNVMAASAEDSSSETAFDGVVTITGEQWDYLQGSLKASNTFACFSLLITCALVGVLLFTNFFGRVEHA